MIASVPPEAGKTWLDVACGTGALATHVARAGAVVTGVDLAPALIETAKRQAGENGLDIDYRVVVTDHVPAGTQLVDARPQRMGPRLKTATRRSVSVQL